MALPAGSDHLFADLFALSTLSPQNLYDALDDAQFEHFVEYVFQQAGFSVEYTALHRGNGLDLKLFADPGSQRLHAGVQVKHYRPYPKIDTVGAPDIVSLRGGLPQVGDATGYLVTTSGFTEPALAEAQHDRRIWPIDGERLIRYIHYVRGSRSATTPEQEVRPPGYPMAPIYPNALFTADGVARRLPNTTRVLTVANHKGGVGKTTTALNLAFGLARQDQQVLLVDMDPQANLSRALPHPHAESAMPWHLDDYFAGRHRLADLVRPTEIKRVWLIASDENLMRSDTGVSAGPEAELRFVRDLHAADVTPPPAIDARPFDWIIIDTGPTMGYFTRMALAASNYVLMPISPGAFADMGLNLLRKTTTTMGALMGSPIPILGCLVTQWHEDRLNQELLAKVRATLDLSGVPILETKIPLDKTNIERAHLETGLGRSRTLIDRRCASARAYTTVVGEVLSVVQT